MQTQLLCRGHFLQFARCLYSGFNELQAQQANTKHRSVINRSSRREDIHLPYIGTGNGCSLPSNELAGVRLSNIMWISQSAILFCGSEYHFATRREKLLYEKCIQTSHSICVAISGSDVTHLTKPIHTCPCFVNS